jgi:hypothetical protein
MEGMASPAMRRLLLVATLVACASAVTAQTPPDSDQPPFHPAQTVSVSDIIMPAGCASNGTVVLDALITEKGKPQALEVRRDVDCITQLATDAVKDWEFSPATLDGKVVASKIVVAVTLCPAGSITDPVQLQSLKPQSDAAIQAEFQPPEVMRAKFPTYPFATTVAGTVVLEVNLSDKGKAGSVKVLQDLPPLTTQAEAVVGDWEFMAATDNGHPIPAKVVLAFIMRPLPSSNNVF